MKALTAFALVATLVGAAHPTFAQTVPSPGWAALASDRTAKRVGDSLTVLVVESSSAAATAQSGSRRDTRVAGSAGVNGQIDASGTLGLQGAFDGRGQTSRTGRLIAQVGVTVDGILSNGDLHITGAQTVEIDGERTAILLTARVRPADINGDNTVLSYRLADAQIIYDGEGDLTRSGQPGPLNRLLSWLGL